MEFQLKGHCAERPEEHPEQPHTEQKDKPTNKQKHKSDTCITTV
jgi:hypothetical protein